jgi:acetolactate decarboxylase
MKLRKMGIGIGMVVLLTVVLSSCQTLPERSDAIYQVSLLNALMLGDYEGSVSVGQLLKHGDTGLGTFDRLEGEMVVLDGVVYQIKADGKVYLKGPADLTPFAAVTFFDHELKDRQFEGIADIGGIKTQLDAVIAQETGDFNRFYVAKLEGDFTMVHVRSVPAQDKPFRPLAEIAKTQPEFHYENVQGTIIALRCPAYVEGINLPGWHLHFLSADKTKGGHLLDANLVSATLAMDIVDEFQLVLPHSELFPNLTLHTNLSTATTAVEGKK